MQQEPVRLEMMVASHNQASLEGAVALMQGLGLPPHCPQVHFGQLQGMADHLTYTLGAAGYQVSPLQSGRHAQGNTGKLAHLCDLFLDDLNTK